MRGESAAARLRRRGRGLLPAPLAVPAYRRLWLSSLLYYHAFHFEAITGGWVVFERTGSPLDVGLLGFCRAIPMFALGLVAGAITDRFRRSSVLLAVQSVGGAAALALALLFAFDAASLPLIYLLTALLGCAWAADYSTRRTLVAEMQAREHVAAALSLEAASMQANKILATFAGGLLLAAGGPTICYGWLALIYACNLLALVRLHRHADTPHGPRAGGEIGVVERIRGGWTVAMHTPAVLGVLLVTMAMNLLVFPYQQMLPVVARAVLGVGPRELGLLAGADGIGALVMGLVLAGRRRQIRPPVLFLGGTFAGAVVVIALAGSRVFALSYALQIVAGVCFGAFGAMQSAIVIGAVAPAMRTRAMGMLATAIGVGPFGALLAGVLSTAFGPAVTLTGMAALALIVIAATVARTRPFRAA